MEACARALAVLEGDAAVGQAILAPLQRMTDYQVAAACPAVFLPLISPGLSSVPGHLAAGTRGLGSPWCWCSFWGLSLARLLGARRQGPAPEWCRNIEQGRHCRCSCRVQL